MAGRIGFVGLGMMGLPMVDNLARQSGLTVVAYDQSDTPFETLARHPAWRDTLLRAENLADLQQCSTVITMLPSSPITNAVIGGGDGKPGLADVLAEGSTIIDMGSSNMADTLALGELLSRRGIRLVDAPVSGSVAKARIGDLSIMVGGGADVLESVRPILSAMGKTLISTGDLGSAHAMKALNNYVYAAGLLAVAEATSIASSMGLDLEVLTDVLNASSGRNVASETKLRQFILNEAYSGGFSLRLQAKDLATASGLQDISGFRAPQLTLCRELWQEASQALPPSADNTEIHRFIRKRGAPAQNSN